MRSPQNGLVVSVVQRGQRQLGPFLRVVAVGLLAFFAVAILPIQAEAHLENRVAARCGASESKAPTKICQAPTFKTNVKKEAHNFGPVENSLLRVTPRLQPNAALACETKKLSVDRAESPTNSRKQGSPYSYGQQSTRMTRSEFVATNSGPGKSSLPFRGPKLAAQVDDVVAHFDEFGTPLPELLKAG